MTSMTEDGIEQKTIAGPKYYYTIPLVMNFIIPFNLIHSMFDADALFYLNALNNEILILDLNF